MKRILTSTAVIILGLSILCSCKGYKTTTKTDTTTKSETESACANVNYTMISAVISDRCLKCHSGPNPKAGADLSVKETVKSIAASGKLLCVVSGNDGCKKMPPMGGSLSDQQIKTIDCWVKNGMLD